MRDMMTMKSKSLGEFLLLFGKDSMHSTPQLLQFSVYSLTHEVEWWHRMKMKNTWFRQRSLWKFFRSFRILNFSHERGFEQNRRSTAKIKWRKNVWEIWEYGNVLESHLCDLCGKMRCPHAKTKQQPGYVNAKSRLVGYLARINSTERLICFLKRPH